MYTLQQKRDNALLVKSRVENTGVYPDKYAISPSFRKLGEYLWYMRREYFQRELEEEIVQLLESLPNWSWDIVPEQLDKADRLDHFMERNNKLPSFVTLDRNELDLYYFMRSMKRYHRDGILDERVIQRLSSLNVLR